MKGQDFEMWEGEDLKLIILGIKGIENVEEDLVFIKWRLAESPESEDTLIEKIWEKDYFEEEISVNQNTIMINLKSDDTKGLGGNRYYQEVKIIDINGNKNPILTGTAKINSSAFVNE